MFNSIWFTIVHACLLAAHKPWMEKLFSQPLLKFWRPTYSWYKQSKLFYFCCCFLGSSFTCKVIFWWRVQCIHTYGSFVHVKLACMWVRTSSSSPTCLLHSHVYVGHSPTLPGFCICHSSNVVVFFFFSCPLLIWMSDKHRSTSNLLAPQ